MQETKLNEKQVEKELSGQENDLPFFVSNDDLNDIIKIIDSREDPGVLIGDVTGKVRK